MQFRNPVHVMASDDREVRHAHPPLAILGDDGQVPLRTRNRRDDAIERRQEIAIDDVDDLEMPWQQPLDSATGQVSSASGNNVWLV